jgi:hypothetical protein
MRILQTYPQSSEGESVGIVSVEGGEGVFFGHDDSVSAFAKV